jgi:hypothetical protein
MKRLMKQLKVIFFKVDVWSFAYVKIKTKSVFISGFTSKVATW